MDKKRGRHPSDLRGSRYLWQQVSLLPAEYLNAVIAIEQLQRGDDGEDAFLPLGSGVLVSRTWLSDAMKGEEEEPWIYLVTNRHVVEGHDKVYAKVNAGESAKRYALELEDDESEPQWFTCGAFDIAATIVPTAVLRDDGAEFEAIPETKWLKLDDLFDAEVGPGDEVFVCGFPLGLHGEQRNWSIVRHGIIARVDEGIIASSGSFLLDCFIFPGNSGGPVFLKPDLEIDDDGTGFVYEPPSLIGIVSGYLPYEDVAISAQTSRPRVTFESNSGLASVVPVDAMVYALDACDDAFLEDLREDEEGSPAAAEVASDTPQLPSSPANLTPFRP